MIPIEEHEKRMALIDRDALARRIRVFIDFECATSETLRSAEIIRRIVIDQPTVDAAPVVHGQWVGSYDGYFDGYPVYDMWECSNCGFDADEADEMPDWKYCPNCGADMRAPQDGYRPEIVLIDDLEGNRNG